MKRSTFYNLKIAGMYALIFILRVLLIALTAAIATFVIWQISICYNLAFSWDHAVYASIGIAVLLPLVGDKK